MLANYFFFMISEIFGVSKRLSFWINPDACNTVYI